MPITSIPAIAPLSSYWTYKSFISEVRALTNEIDNERVQDSNIINHLNIVVGNVAELLNLAAEPWYGVIWPGTSAAADATCPVPYIDLGVAVGSQTPNQLLWKIRRITVTNASPVFLDNARYCALEEITTLAKRRGATDVSNTQYADTIAWHHTGNLIYLYTPTQITSVYTSLNYFVHAYRQPVLIDPTQINQWANRVDLPDRFVRLALKLVQGMVLEQMNKQMSPEMDAQIQAMTNQITQNIVAETQFSASQRSKESYNLQTR